MTIPERVIAGSAESDSIQPYPFVRGFFLDGDCAEL